MSILIALCFLVLKRYLLNYSDNIGKGAGAIVFDATLKGYLKEIDEADLLSWEDEKQLSCRIIEHSDPEARDLLVRSNLRLVVNIAKSYARSAENFGDLIEEGNLGLLRAVDSFDPDHGVRFSTYASWWIKQSIKRSLLENAQPIHIPTYMVELINHYRHIAAELESDLGRKPTINEMANEMNLPERKAKAVKKIVETVEAGFQGESPEQSFSLDETLKDDQIGLPEDELCDHEELEKAVMLLEEIDPRQAQILKHRFGLDGCELLTLKQIGKKLGLTRERVRQIQTEALTRLHELMLE